MFGQNFDNLHCIGLVGCEDRQLGSVNSCDGANLVFQEVRVCFICFFEFHIRQKLVPASYLASFFEITRVLVDGQADEPKFFARIGYLLE